MSGELDNQTKGLNLNEKSSDLLAYVNERRKAGLFNDITIQCDDMKISANKIVLSCYSEYFKAMFDIEMQERYQDTVEMKGFDGDVIKMLIDYMYGETIFINRDNVMQVLVAADYLQMHGVKNDCIDFLQVGLTVDNCLDALLAYDMHRPTAEYDHVYHFISKNFPVIYRQEKLNQLSKNQIVQMLTKINKNEVNQEHLFEIVTSWISNDECKRKTFFAELFQAIDLFRTVFWKRRSYRIVL